MSNNSSNSSDKIALPVRGFPMEDFDKLSEPLRRCIANAPYPLGIHRHKADITDEVILAALKQQMPEIIRRSALLAYGPDHPQAQ